MPSRIEMASQATAVGRAWASYDIIVAIFETMALNSLDPPWKHERRRNQKTLARSRVARVCRALSGIALDILWRYIRDIFHLIDVVPSCYTFGLYSNIRIGPDIVSPYIEVCESTRTDNNTWSSRGSLGSHPNMSCTPFVPTLPEYESLSFHVTSNIIPPSIFCCSGCPQTSPSYPNYADYTRASLTA